MTDVTDNTDQAAFWGGDAGDKWVAQQEGMDALLLPVLQGVLARASLRPGEAVLDVGCGTGQSTVLAAEAVGTKGHVLGADISETMLDLAQARAAGMAQVDTVYADVATHGFAPHRFDVALSRFGVMFFADTTAAFANIARSLKPEGRICFATWGQIERNPWFTMPARITREVIGPVDKTDPDAPGPFALRDIDKVCGYLRDAGLREVSVDVADMAFPMPGGPRGTAQICNQIGPAGRALEVYKSPAADQQRLEDALTQAFADLPGGVIPAEINFFTGTA